MAVRQDEPGNPGVHPVVRWVLLLLGATLVSMLFGFAVGLARPRTTSLPVRGTSAAPVGGEA